MSLFNLYLGLINELRISRISGHYIREELIEEEMTLLWYELTPEEQVRTEVYAPHAFPPPSMIPKRVAR